MRNEYELSSDGAGRDIDLTTNPGNGIPTITTFNYPPLEYYNTLPDQFKDYPIIERKPMITNWEFIKEKSFDKFLQSGSVLFPFTDRPIYEMGPIKMGDNWPVNDFVPISDVRIERVPYFDVIYVLKYKDEIFEAAGVAWGPNVELPEIIGYKVKKGFDDVAVYIGPCESGLPFSNEQIHFD